MHQVSTDMGPMEVRTTDMGMEKVTETDMGMVTAIMRMILPSKKAK